jgi:myxalamid-type polyketide synthase MxaB
MGHSVGEYAAACLAGVFSLEDGLKLIAARGRLMQALPAHGSMAVVFAERAQVEAALAPYADEVSIAAVNGPTQIALSGVTEAVQTICAGFAEQGIKTRPMTVSHAFHSPLMEPILEEFGRVAREVVYALPKIEVISNLTGRSVGGRIATADYWVEHIRQPVECMAGLATLREQGCRVYVEIGPQPVLVGLGRQQSDDPGALWLASMRAGESDWGCLLSSLGQLYCAGVPLAWRDIQRGFAGRRIELPTYPFQRQSYWKELQPTAQPAPSAERPAGHPLLGARLDLPGGEQIRYSAALSARRPEFLGDHRVGGAAVFPASGYVELCLAAAAAALDTARIALDDLAILRPLALPDSQPCQVQAVLTPAGAESWSAQLFCRDAAGEWQLHATASLSAAAEEPPSRADLAALQAGARALPVDEHYRRCAQQGLDYGPAFQAVRRLWLRDGSVLAALELESQADAYLLHPALLDAAFQALAAVQIEQSGDTYLPVGLAGLRLYRRAGPAVWAEARLHAPAKPGAATLRADLVLYDAEGAPVATVRELILRRTDPAAIQTPGEQRPLYRLDWQRCDLPQARPPAAPGTWLVFADRRGLGAQLRALLEAAGQRCVLVAPGAQFEQIEPELFQISPSADADFRRLLHEALPASAPPCRGALFLWPLDDDTPAADDGLALVELQERGSASVLRLAQALPGLAGAPPQLWLVTRGTQQLAAAPGASIRPLHAPIWGLGRVIALEHPELRCARVDLAPEPAADEARLLSALLGAGLDEDQLALRGGQIYAPRLAPLPDSAAEPAYQLQIREYGVLDDLALRPVTRRAPGPGEIEIRVAAVGLNLRDVLHALGMLPDTAAALPFGFECAGLVTAVGPEAEGFAVGDPVISGLTVGAMGSFITTPAARCAPLPPGMSFAEAATLPLAFLTAFYGLQHLAQLKRGERVLIHAAAGGVGQAAVQLALHAGAEVWATAHPDKWDFLRAQGVRHVLNSRTLDFAEQIREATGGQGVDVVLNSLNGAFIDQSFAALRDGGRFVEIGKIGIWGQARVEALGRAISYYHFDMSSVSQEQPELIGALFRQVLDLIGAGALRPLPLRAFAISQAAEAFRTMAQAQHIGKIVLTWPPEQIARPPAVRPDASYLISGGLGFIGLQIARWIVERGGRHLALLARSQPSRAALDQIAALEQAGARVLVVQADVARADDLRRALDQIGAHLPPLRGVVHAAGVLEDGTLQQQRWPQFQRVLEPKVAGAWNLHRLTRDLPLDLFVLCSSLAGLLGSAGQANYAAANAFLDALACQRRTEGRAGTSLAWGLWEGGMGAALSAQDRARLSAQGVQVLTADRALALLEEALQHPDAQIGVLPVSWAVFLRQFAQTPPLLRRLGPQNGLRPPQLAARISLLEQLEDTPPEERRAVLVAHVRGQVAGILGFPSPDEVAVGQELARLGIDSLTGVELSNRLKSSTGRPLASTLIFDCPTVEQIAAHLEGLLLPQEPAPAPAASGPGTELEVAEMSEDEAEMLLLEELRRLGQ